MKRILVLLVMAVAPSLWAAGTCVVSDVTSSQNAAAKIPDSGTVIVTLTCVGDASTGSFPATTVPLTGSYPSGTIRNAYNLTGYYLYEVGRTPGATQPTASWTTVITDAQGFVMSLALMTTNGSASASLMTPMTSATAPYPVYNVVRSALSVAISANSVASANITLDLIFRSNL